MEFVSIEHVLEVEEDMDVGLAKVWDNDISTRLKNTWLKVEVVNMVVVARDVEAMETVLEVL